MISTPLGRPVEPECRSRRRGRRRPVREEREAKAHRPFQDPHLNGRKGAALQIREMCGVRQDELGFRVLERRSRSGRGLPRIDREVRGSGPHHAERRVDGRVNVRARYRRRRPGRCSRPKMPRDVRGAVGQLRIGDAFGAALDGRLARHARRLVGGERVGNRPARGVVAFALGSAGHTDRGRLARPKRHVLRRKNHSHPPTAATAPVPPRKIAVPPQKSTRGSRSASDPLKGGRVQILRYPRNGTQVNLRRPIARRHGARSNGSNIARARRPVDSSSS